MEPMSLILTAVVAGESKAETPTLRTPVEDDFAGLRERLRAALNGRPGAQQALETFLADPVSGRETLIAGLSHSGAVGDPEVLDAAQQVMYRIDPEGARNGNYQIT